MAEKQARQEARSEGDAQKEVLRGIFSLDSKPYVTFNKGRATVTFEANLAHEEIPLTARVHVHLVVNMADLSFTGTISVPYLEQHRAGDTRALGIKVPDEIEKTRIDAANDAEKKQLRTASSRLRRLVLERLELTKQSPLLTLASESQIAVNSLSEHEYGENKRLLEALHALCAWLKNASFASDKREFLLTVYKKIFPGRVIKASRVPEIKSPEQRIREELEEQFKLRPGGGAGLENRIERQINVISGREQLNLHLNFVLEWSLFGELWIRGTLNFIDIQDLSYETPWEYIESGRDKVMERLVERLRKRHHLSVNTNGMPSLAVVEYTYDFGRKREIQRALTGLAGFYEFLTGRDEPTAAERDKMITVIQGGIMHARSNAERKEAERLAAIAEKERQAELEAARKARRNRFSFWD